MKISTFFLLLPALVISNIYCAGSEKPSALEVSQTPLMLAAADDNLEKLIQELDQPGVNINAQDSQGRTALFIATQEGKADNVKELLKRKADISIADNDGMTPLQAAVTSGDADTVNALLETCEKVDGKCKNVDQTDKKLQFTPLARAARSGNAEIIKLLLAAGANPMAQVALGDKNVSVTELIKPDDKEASALIQDKLQEYRDRGLVAFEALLDNRPDEAIKLIAQGIDVSVKDQLSNTLLIVAVGMGFKEVVELLLKAGADVTAQDISTDTPLHWAAVSGYKDIVKLLIDNKADVNAINNLGTTPLTLAVEKGHKELADMLRKAGATK